MLAEAECRPGAPVARSARRAARRTRRQAGWPGAGTGAASGTPGHGAGATASGDSSARPSWWPRPRDRTLRVPARLRSELRMPGTAWVEFRVGTGPDGDTEYHQDVTFVPRGLAGHFYWWLQRPMHDVVFGLMAHGIVHSAEGASPAPDLQVVGAATQ
ncbi:MAG TPA: DUF2867 domain-containing protein [Pseudonocardiaceae bacterium]|nr:DUF2867 domain-containing protein [Pseudonocardiaceae bacterium]